MTKIDYLKQPYRLQKRIQLEMEQMAQFKSLAENGQAPSSGEGGGGGGMAKSFMEIQTVRYISLKEQVERDTAKLQEVTEVIQKAIRDLNNLEMEYVLEARYLFFKSWKEIADELGLSIESMWVFKLHGKAVDRINLPVFSAR